MFHHFKDPVMIVDGSMQYLFDEAGRRYLDVRLLSGRLMFCSAALDSCYSSSCTTLVLTSASARHSTCRARIPCTHVGGFDCCRHSLAS